MVHVPVRVLVGSLGRGMVPDAAAPPPAGTILLDLGPEHPSDAGLLELDLWTADGVVTGARVIVGAMHRGAEKLFEVRDYRQILMLADRHDWQAPFSGELSVALACELALGLEVPPRAVWLRTLLAEHTRILSHCGFLMYVPHRRAAAPVARGLRDLRETLRVQTQSLTGNRVHPMVNRVGGLAVDATGEWLRSEREAMVAARAVAHRVADLLESAELSSVTRSVAPLTRGTIEQYGVTGPAARASGADLDLRRHRPYLAYADLVHLIPAAAHTDGDAAARLRLLTDEIGVSADLADACADRLDQLAGPVEVKLNKIVKLPEGETYLAVEAPLGVAGVFLVSRGEKTPWRLKLRTPSFNNIAALEAVLVGVPIAALEVTLASIGYVVGDIDR